MGEIKIRNTVFWGPENLLLRNEEDRNVTCVISAYWILSFSETVNETRLGQIYEGTRGLTFSEHFICSFKSTLDPS